MQQEVLVLRSKVRDSDAVAREAPVGARGAPTQGTSQSSIGAMTVRRACSRSRRLGALGALALAAAVAVPVGSARLGRPAITLALTSNVKGLLTTCKSCSYVTVGGMAQKATLFKGWRKAAGADFVAVDAGDWSEYGASFPNNVTVIAAMKKLGYAAANVGDSEAAFGQQLFDAARQSGLPLISATLLDAQTGRRVLPPEIIVTVKGVRVGVIGVVGPEAPATGFAIPSRYRLADVNATLADLVPKLRSRCDLLVVLAHVPLDEAKRLATEISGIDVIVGGSVHGKVPPGEMAAQTLVIQPHRYAVALVKMTAAAGRYRAAKWSAEIVPRSVREDPEMAALVQRGVHLPGPVGMRVMPCMSCRGYVGAERCGTCHAPVYAAWKATPHAKAWDSLAKGKKQSDLACQWCHTTSLPGEAASTDLKGMQCEACHGPFSLHEERYVKGHYKPSADEWLKLCRTCHDPKNSPEFDLQSYWAKVIKQGHGKQ